MVDEQQQDAGDTVGASPPLQPYLHTEVSGAINQHTPPYWRLALPALGARYVARYVTQFADKLEAIKPGFKGFPDRTYDALAGAWMMAVTTFFAYRTAEDMKTIFREVVGYEFNKDPKDVGITDLLRSRNPMVEQARSNFISMNFKRFIANSTFFTSFMPGESTLAKTLRTTPAVDLGMGTNSLYLASEIIGRSRTFFEQVQSFVDSKLSSKNSLGEPITSIEMMRLFQSNAKINDSANAMNAKTEPEVVKNGHVIFQRVAELMNHTYINKIHGEKDNFTLPKFLYLLSYNLIQPKNVKESLLHIEVANKYGIGTLKDVVAAEKNGASIDDLISVYHVNIKIPEKQNSSPEIVPNEQTKRFAEGIPSKAAHGHAGGHTAAHAPAEVAGGSFISRVKDAEAGPALAG